MTPQQQRLLRDSLNQLTPDRDAVAARFYQRLFQRDPELRQLFPEDMTQQRRRFMAVLSLVVDAADGFHRIEPLLADLGRRHVDYGVVNADYTTFRETLLETLAVELGPGFTPTVRTAWDTLLRQVTTTMTRAADELTLASPRQRAALLQRTRQF